MSKVSSRTGSRTRWSGTPRWGWRTLSPSLSLTWGSSGSWCSLAPTLWSVMNCRVWVVIWAVLSLPFQVVTAPGYEDFTTKFTLNSSSCVDDNMSLQEAQRIDVKMLKESPRHVPFSFNSQPDPPSRNRVYYPDQVNPYQEETKITSTTRTKLTIAKIINSKTHTNTKVPSNRPGVLDSSHNPLGTSLTRNTTPPIRYSPRNRRRRRRPANKGTDSQSLIGLRFADEYEYYDSHVDGIERCWSCFYISIWQSTGPCHRRRSPTNMSPGPEATGSSWPQPRSYTNWPLCSGHQTPCLGGTLRCDPRMINTHLPCASWHTRRSSSGSQVLGPWTWPQCESSWWWHPLRSSPENSSLKKYLMILLYAPDTQSWR